MTESLDAAYFDGIFAHDDDPWNLATSDYEAAKFARTVSLLADRHYADAIEIGCAHGVLTEQLLPLCDRLLAVDISEAALAHARRRLGARAGLELRRMAFPAEAPGAVRFDLTVLSEVTYYWSDDDLARAGRWLERAVAPGGRVILVHYRGETDYPQTGDAAVEALRARTEQAFDVEHAERHARYRLDLWTRR